jgi:anti-anti-sigma factor
MEVTEDRHGRVVVLAPAEDMDLNALPAFESKFAAHLAGGVRAVLWDLGAVTILPSAAIGFLLHAARRLHAAGGHMGLARPSRFVRSTLNVMGVGEMFRTYDTVAEGISDLEARAGAS